ncbi:MAG: GNAT family N-acetyltransferase [Chloroflexota bacterium]
MYQEPLSPIVRIATTVDATHLAHLYEHIEARSLSTSHMLARLQAAQALETIFLAEVGEQVVALACLRLAPTLTSETPHAEITELYVPGGSPEQQIEQLLLEQCEILARQRGAQSIALLAGLKNENAQGLYHRLGYRDYALAMRKLLGVA